MAKIVINEISQNYTYNIGSSSFATVAFPITAAWGPAFGDEDQSLFVPAATKAGKDTKTDSAGTKIQDALENTAFIRFPATQAGLEAFVSTYRGPETNYRMTKDYSYYIAMTLLTAGYDVLVCRVCPGTKAEVWYDSKTHSSSTSAPTNGLHISAKYPGSFGSQLSVVVKEVSKGTVSVTTGEGDHPTIETKAAPGAYWNLIVYAKDSSGTKTAVENLSFVCDETNSTDTLLYVDEVSSSFIDIKKIGNVDDNLTTSEKATIELSGGDDYAAVTESTDEKIPTEVQLLQSAVDYAKYRYSLALGETNVNTYQYVKALQSLITSTGDTGNLTYSTNTDKSKAKAIRHNEWVYCAAYEVYDLLTDRLSYNPNRIISPGWDDQWFEFLGANVDENKGITEISPLHNRLMYVGYYSRCGTALIDIPRSEPRKFVYNDKVGSEGYAQMLSASGTATNVGIEGSTVVVTGLTDNLYDTHSALFAPWGQYKYVGTGKQNAAAPSFLALMIQRAMILNQSLQYEWALPTNRQHNLKIGKLDYIVNNKLLNEWQSLEGVGVNVITDIPGSGTTLWGNSTLYDVPPATYQALANLSTRYLVNAVEDVAFRCGMQITFRYNNQEAYSSFYAGCTPILDTMKNVGAIEDYYIEMSADIDKLSSVNANTVVGKIYLVVNGVINDIYIDLIALPQGTDLSQYRS